MSGPRLYLLDVEGTVAPVSFVTETLFPYARSHLARFLHVHANDTAVQDDLRLLAEENRAETDEGCPTLGVEISDELHAFYYLSWLMRRDRKSTALKSLQGKIWKAGYERGELKSVLFDDVPKAFARWSKQARIAIYSSGSADAQRLFFRHSNHGDLTPTISGYFDTRTGPKPSSASYAAIAAAMSVASEEVLFFSDAVKELDAAREAGCGTRLVMREGNAPVDSSPGHAIIRSFHEAAEDDRASGSEEAGRL